MGTVVAMCVWQLFSTLLLCVAGAHSLSAESASTPLKTATSIRGFHTTPEGQIHYVTAGNPLKQTTLLLLHGHPRSTNEFKGLVEALGDKYAFVALDFFGFGSSDECLTCDPDTNSHVGVKQWAGYVIEIMDALNIKTFVPVGSLKGTYSAVYITQAYPQRVDATVLVLPLWLNNATLTKVEGYMNMAKHPHLNATGQHLLNAWADTSAGGGMDLVHNEDKTLDNLRSLKGGWGYLWHMFDMNDALLPAMKAFSHKTLLVWGEKALAGWDQFGFQTNTSCALIEAALRESGSAVTVQKLRYGYESSMAVNSTSIASWIEELLAV